MTQLSLDSLRRDAKRLHRAYLAREPLAVERVRQHPPRPDLSALRRADFLHIVAQETGFASWPRLKLAAETMGLDRAARQQRLKIALSRGQTALAAHLLEETPDLAQGLFGLQCALYDLAGVKAGLARDPGLAVKSAGPRRPILHLCFSRWIHQHPELEVDMIAVADLLLAQGADVNDGQPASEGSSHQLSALYGAIGQANNMVLGRWLLSHGADPNDGESLYHATELGHHEGLRMLLAAGADPRGTNALFRAMDFNDHEAVAMLLAHGATADDAVDGTVSALHHAARRGCDRRMADLMLRAGADPARRFKGVTPYAMARVFGAGSVAEAVAEAGGPLDLTREEALMARAADGLDSPGEFIDPARLEPAYHDLLREMVHLPDRLDHMRRLVALGVEYDRPDAQEKVTPLHIAGWSGKPEVLQWLISLRPDMAHVNGFGGTLLSTILHGSENNPAREQADYLGCLELAMTAGVALPRHVIAMAGREDVRAFLEDWAEAHPGQVV